MCCCCCCCLPNRKCCCYDEAKRAQQIQRNSTGKFPRPPMPGSITSSPSRATSSVADPFTDSDLAQTTSHVSQHELEGDLIGTPSETSSEQTLKGPPPAYDDATRR